MALAGHRKIFLLFLLRDRKFCLHAFAFTSWGFVILVKTFVLLLSLEKCLMDIGFQKSISSFLGGGGWVSSLVHMIWWVFFTNWWVLPFDPLASVLFYPFLFGIYFMFLLSMCLPICILKVLSLLKLQISRWSRLLKLSYSFSASVHLCLGVLWMLLLTVHIYEGLEVERLFLILVREVLPLMCSMMLALCFVQWFSNRL